MSRLFQIISMQTFPGAAWRCIFIAFIKTSISCSRFTVQDSIVSCLCSVRHIWPVNWCVCGFKVAVSRYKALHTSTKVMTTLYIYRGDVTEETAQWSSTFGLIAFRSTDSAIFPSYSSTSAEEMRQHSDDVAFSLFVVTITCWVIQVQIYVKLIFHS